MSFFSLEIETFYERPSMSNDTNSSLMPMSSEMTVPIAPKIVRYPA
ncbi:MULTISPECIES: hypothetical protein [unclassified Rhizobium]|nr:MULTISPECIES: hypothetical protein [unclassified Rhizobium]MBB3318770.1 hypothetical protein [Rhizobium sp. BK181]MBB3543103.1 hypothetical protein [Rhizobium sp. BK399]MCS3742318.1 hypothetical protein [Rhizobium sp. BK661]MCS4094854.1 hypothetical protein [Rhizobium sp. BK176]